MLLRAVILAAFVAACAGEVEAESAAPVTSTSFWADCGGVDNFQECADNFMKACRADHAVPDPGCVGIMCEKKPPGCVTGLECACYLHRCYSFDDSTTTTTTTATPPGELEVSTTTKYTKPQPSTTTEPPKVTLPYVGNDTSTTTLVVTTPVSEETVTTTTTTTEATTTTTEATATTTEATTTTLATIPEPFCECSDKTEFMDVLLDGKVNGGGWLYLTEKSFYNCAAINATGPSCNINGAKMNFGFNAMFRDGVPHGTTSFGLESKHFHFLSEQGNTPYHFLEIKRDGVNAQWMGTGSISTYSCQCGREWLHGFCFMVTVKDLGEPGHLDQVRMRVWDCQGKTGIAGCNAGNLADLTALEFAKTGDKQECLVLDTNYVPTGGVGSSEYVQSFPLPGTGLQLGDARFNGTEIGELGATHGGGNVQVQLKNKTNAFLEWMEDSGIECAVCPVNQTELASSDVGYVTGNGYVLLGHDSYLKATGGCSYETMMEQSPGADLEYSRMVGYKYQANTSTGEGDCKSRDSVSGRKATYSFTAKHVNGVPVGSLSFSVPGINFYFKSVATEYDCVEIVCNNAYGGAMYAGPARITGVGKVSFTDSTYGWSDLYYRFWAIVVDNGEPGYLDTIRMRIEDIDMPGSILFDTNYNSGPMFRNSDISLSKCPKYPTDGTHGTVLQDPMCDVHPSKCEREPDFIGLSLVQMFNGTQEGLNDIMTKSGGNIRLYCK